jgi:ubiquinone/menaquinone biosynthesis C-methylase UbiE
MNDIFKNQIWMKIEKSDRLNPTSQHRFSYDWTRNYFKKNFKVLDIGCLFGNYMVLFKDSAIKMYGLDIYKDIIEDDKKKFPNMKFCTASVLDMPFQSNYFDAITLWETIEHIPQGTESKAFSEIRRLLKKNGYLFLSTPQSNFLANTLDMIQILFKKHRHYKEKEIVDLIKDAGFKVEKIEYHGRYLEAVYWWYHILLKRLMKLHPLDTKFGRELDKKVEKEFKRKGFMEIWIIAKAI